MEDKPLIETRDLGKKFNNNWAVSNLNITVRKGQIYGFLGPNGAGKSTTIRLLMGLVRPTRGNFKLFGQKVGVFNKNIYSRIGAIIEEPSFYSFLTGHQNLLYLGQLIRNISEARIDQIFELVGLSEQKFKRVSDYSHGMKKRLGIAQALLHDPELLILDEPTSGLDPEGINQIQQLLQNLVHEKDKTIFLSSHHLREIQNICTHVGVINYGKLVKEGSVEELLKSTEFFITEVSVDKPLEALDMLLEQNWVNKISLCDEKLRLHISRGRRAQLTKFLVENGFEVYAVKPRTSIEDYYISLMKSEHKVRQ